jgi:LPS O-antigen subunit length determinant protein (WzzB/FepE family)
MHSESYGPSNGSGEPAPGKDAPGAGAPDGGLQGEGEVLKTLGMAQIALDHIDDVVARVRRVMPIAANAAPASTEQESLRSTLRAVRRSWWIILICGAVGVAGALAATRSKPVRYEAVTSLLLLVDNSYQQAIAGGYNPVDPQRRQATISDLVTPTLLNRAANRAGLAPSDTYTVTAEKSATSDVMGIRASTGRASTAAALANATANELIRFVRHSDAEQLTQARAVLQSQIAGARSADDRHTLVGKLNNLAALQALTDQAIQIIQRASIPVAPTSRRTASLAAIGLVLGILFGLAFSLLRSRGPATPH